MKNLAFILALAFSYTSFSQGSESPFVSFEDYENLMTKVKEHRQTRLVSLDQFNQMSSLPEVYILDTRSKEMYDRKHIKGAIHLNFSDFTQANLDALFPNRNATILIYCNNNFINDLNADNPVQAEFFATKASRPEPDFSILEQQLQKEPVQSEERSIEEKSNLTEPEKPITLALNIPTYINLYGYGYRNVYELSDLVSIYDSRIEFEGTAVDSIQN